MRKINWKMAATSGAAVGVGLGGFALADSASRSPSEDRIELIPADRRISSPSSRVARAESSTAADSPDSPDSP